MYLTNKVVINKDFSVPSIKSVNIEMASSTYNAHIFNMAMQMLCIDWQDPIIEEVERLIKERLIEQEDCAGQGFDWLITMKKSSGTFKIAYRVATNKRARELATMKYPEYEIESITKRVY